jgi:hypothetical protein
MGQTSVVHAAVKAGGKWYVASKEIKVTRRLRRLTPDRSDENTDQISRLLLTGEAHGRPDARSRHRKRRRG